MSTTDPASSEPGPIATTTPKRPRLVFLAATALGLGYLPQAPGTWGSLGGLALLWVLETLQQRLAIFQKGIVLPLNPYLWCAVISLLGVWAAGRAEEHLGTKDPQVVVIDEVSGQMLALLLGPALFEGAVNWKSYLLGFILFRVFDIWKPYPARRAEAMPAGWGVMADDWVAGAYAAAGLWVARYFGW